GRVVDVGRERPRSLSLPQMRSMRVLSCLVEHRLHAGALRNRRLAEHPLDLVRVKRAGRSCASDKQKVRVSTYVYVASVEAVESSDHDHKPLAHAAFEEFASDIVPLVQPVVDLPHLL